MASRVVEVQLPNTTLALGQMSEPGEREDVAEKVEWRDIFDFDQVLWTSEGLGSRLGQRLAVVTLTGRTVEFGSRLDRPISQTTPLRICRT